jgi:hypothetical protein
VANVTRAVALLLLWISCPNESETDHDRKPGLQIKFHKTLNFHYTY